MCVCDNGRLIYSIQTKHVFCDQFNDQLLKENYVMGLFILSNIFCIIINQLRSNYDIIVIIFYLNTFYISQSVFNFLHLTESDGEWLDG